MIEIVQRNRKRVILIALLLLGAIAITYVALLTPAHKVDVTIQGLNYQLGIENRDNVQPESVTLKGYWTRSLKGVRQFKGTIAFAHEKLPVPVESRTVTVLFHENGVGSVIYAYIKNAGLAGATPVTYGSGTLFANADFSSIVYLRMRQENDQGQSVTMGWNGEDGLMFAGPATTREEAVELSNALMEKFLRNDGVVGGRFVLK